jgi:hypothetical protein
MPNTTVAVDIAGIRKTDKARRLSRSTGTTLYIQSGNVSLLLSIFASYVQLYAVHYNVFLKNPRVR